MTTMRLFILITGTVLFFMTSSLANSIFPVGWREPTQKETKDGLWWRGKDPYRYLQIKADFNGDGYDDEAKLLVKRDGTKIGLFVFLSQDGQIREILLDEMEGMGWIEAMGIAKVTPGRYRTACGKGYSKCGPDEPEVLILKRPAINYFKFESANSFFYWDDTKRAFKRIWISD